MSLAVLKPLRPYEPLETVQEWDLEVPYHEFRPQILLPPTLSAPQPLEGHRTYVVINQKGGAGKTTTAAELACAWVAMGYTVRIIDADAQDASLSSWLRPRYPENVPVDDRKDLQHVFYGKAALDEVTYYTDYERLYLVPSTKQLALVEYNPEVAREMLLRTAIRESVAPIDIDIIDCPPSLGKLSIYSLIAGDEVLVPMQVSALDKLGLNSLEETLRATQKDYPGLTVRAAVLTGWAKNDFARKLARIVQSQYPEAIIAPARRSVRAAEAPEHHQPVRTYAPSSTTSCDYDQLGHLLLPVKGAS
jgi:chromosome partitioning protein